MLFKNVILDITEGNKICAHNTNLDIDFFCLTEGDTSKWNTRDSGILPSTA